MSALLNRLPTVRGRYTENFELAKVTWFRVGGPAEVLFKPADVDDLVQFIAACPQDIPLTVLGVGSNLLVRDGGIPGVVIRLGKGFVDIETAGADVRCGAGALDGNVALAAQQAGITGMEFLCGIPGTIGGALRMNAGAYGTEMKDIVVSAKAIGPDGVIHKLSVEDLGFTYRHSIIPESWVFIEAHLRGHAANADDVARRMEDIRSTREASQPIRTATGGSTFRNPEGHQAWRLIDEAGCRGLTRGGAMVSDKHCNFLINTGTATANDLEGLGEEVRARVLAHSGISLEWEIKRVGVNLEEATL